MGVCRTSAQADIMIEVVGALIKTLEDIGAKYTVYRECSAQFIEDL